MLQVRSIIATLSGETLEVSATRGCAPRGALPPLLWSLVVDGLLGELNGGYYSIRYVHDIAILMNGKFPQTISEVLQAALWLIHQWCDRTGLSINPRKTVVVPFTKREL
jgi:hypothetical protein